MLQQRTAHDPVMRSISLIIAMLLVLCILAIMVEESECVVGILMTRRMTKLRTKVYGRRRKTIRLDRLQKARKRRREAKKKKRAFIRRWRKWSTYMKKHRFEGPYGMNIR